MVTVAFTTEEDKEMLVMLDAILDLAQDYHWGESIKKFIDLRLKINLILTQLTEELIPMEERAKMYEEYLGISGLTNDEEE